MRLTLVAGLSAMLLAAPAWAGDMKSAAGSLGADDCAPAMDQSAEIQPEAELRGDEMLSREGLPDLEEPAGDIASSPETETAGVEEHMAGTLPEPHDDIAAGQSEDQGPAAESEDQSGQSFDVSRLSPDQDENQAGVAPAEKPALE